MSPTASPGPSEPRPGLAQAPRSFDERHVALGMVRALLLVIVVGMVIGLVAGELVLRAAEAGLGALGTGTRP